MCISGAQLQLGIKRAGQCARSFDQSFKNMRGEHHLVTLSNTNGSNRSRPVFVDSSANLLAAKLATVRAAVPIAKPALFLTIVCRPTPTAAKRTDFRDFLGALSQAPSVRYWTPRSRLLSNHPFGYGHRRQCCGRFEKTPYIPHLDGGKSHSLLSSVRRT